MLRPLLFCTLLLSIVAQPARAKEYAAERFDSEIEVLRGGTLRVTETVRLRFEEGTFTEFFREIPTQGTDGVDIVSAAMDGVGFTPGAGPGLAPAWATYLKRHRGSVPPRFRALETNDNAGAAFATFVTAGGSGTGGGAGGGGAAGGGASGAR